MREAKVCLLAARLGRRAKSISATRSARSTLFRQAANGNLIDRARAGDRRGPTMGARRPLALGPPVQVANNKRASAIITQFVRRPSANLAGQLNRAPRVPLQAGGRGREGAKQSGRRAFASGRPVGKWAENCRRRHLFLRLPAAQLACPLSPAKPFRQIIQIFPSDSATRARAQQRRALVSALEVRFITLDASVPFDWPAAPAARQDQQPVALIGQAHLVAGERATRAQSHGTRARTL